ncbi:hypothetical protein ABZ865_00085 [Streptomyces sp. NPDC047085]|uniref:hypothetical protein n=1 Tax=Streptomyces sp. NPDC047085 TaxID=3155140 RepID=UPI0033D968A9
MRVTTPAPRRATPATASVRCRAGGAGGPRTPTYAEHRIYGTQAPARDGSTVLGGHRATGQLLDVALAHALGAGLTT